MEKIFRTAFGLAGALLLGSGCVFSSKEVSVSRDDSLGKQRDYFRNELTNPNGLALESENFLRGNLMQDDFCKNPQMILAKLNGWYKISGNVRYLSIAADLCRYLATQHNESEAIQYHLSTLYYCTNYTRLAVKQDQEKKDGTYNCTATQGLQVYNEACCGLFSFLAKRNLLDANSITLRDAEGHVFTMGKPIYRLSVPKEAISEFSLCASYSVKDLMQINRQPGIGVPLVGRIKMKQWYRSLKTPQGLTIPVTLMVRRSTGPDGEMLQLIFVDTSLQENFQQRIAGGPLFQSGMALDFSTPLACFLSELPSRNLLGDMLNPRAQEAHDGLYMIEPYQPNKIPVVCIHGLMSSPGTWVQMINSLKNDPMIRKRYQFWFFYYSTGIPVLFSAQKLRDALRAAEKEFCTTPEATANFNKMVLIGHSMGGLLTRLMLQKDPHFILENMGQISWEEVKTKLQPEDLSWVEERFVTPSLPFVHRAIFMAVPHKGANMAQSMLARLGIALIKLPQSFRGNALRLKRLLKTLRREQSLGEELRNDFFTGIDNLNPANPFVCAAGKSPMKEDLVYHCVIGNVREGGIPGGSDGVVPYWSSHLDNAASELVVQSDHSVHRRPEAIQEVLRILLEHLKAVDREPTGAARK